MEQAIKDGCQNVNEIYDETTAGLGPCGGSCRPKLHAVLEHYKETGEFLTAQQIKEKFQN